MEQIDEFGDDEEDKVCNGGDDCCDNDSNWCCCCDKVDVVGDNWTDDGDIAATTDNNCSLQFSSSIMYEMDDGTDLYKDKQLHCFITETFVKSYWFVCNHCECV